MLLLLSGRKKNGRDSNKETEYELTSRYLIFIRRAMGANAGHQDPGEVMQHKKVAGLFQTSERLGPVAVRC